MEKERIKLDQERIKLREDRIKFEEERNAFRSTMPVYKICPICEGSNVNPGMRHQESMVESMAQPTDYPTARAAEEEDFCYCEGYATARDAEDFLERQPRYGGGHFGHGGDFGHGGHFGHGYYGGGYDYYPYYPYSCCFYPTLY